MLRMAKGSRGCQKRKKLPPMARVAEKLPSTIGTGLLLSKMVCKALNSEWSLPWGCLHVKLEPFASVEPMPG